jgi:hypothetical protein
LLGKGAVVKEVEFLDLIKKFVAGGEPTATVSFRIA